MRERLQGAAVERLAGAEEVWVALDTTDLRKPYATEMEALMEVRDLKKRPVPGYRVLNALGMTPTARGLLYHGSSVVTKRDSRASRTSIARLSAAWAARWLGRRPGQR